jgi:hypothetical protein
MGYDMSIEAPLSEAEQIAKDAAKDQCDAAVKERGKYERNTPEWEAAQEKVMAASDAHDALNLNYFRLNIWGMGHCLEHMYERGMVYTSEHEGEWPQYTEPARMDGEDDAAWYARIDAYDELYQKKCLPIVSAHPAGGDTIPAHKFCSNDGWLVTEEECKAAVTSNALFDPPVWENPNTKITEPVQWWPEWIAFLERASTRGGFRVH